MRSKQKIQYEKFGKSRPPSRLDRSQESNWLSNIILNFLDTARVEKNNNNNQKPSSNLRNAPVSRRHSGQQVPGQARYQHEENRTRTQKKYGPIPRKSREAQFGDRDTESDSIPRVTYAKRKSVEQVGTGQPMADKFYVGSYINMKTIKQEHMLLQQFSHQRLKKNTLFTELPGLINTHFGTYSTLTQQRQSKRGKSVNANTLRILAPKTNKAAVFGYAPEIKSVARKMTKGNHTVDRNGQERYAKLKLESAHKIKSVASKTSHRMETGEPNTQEQRSQRKLAHKLATHLEDVASNSTKDKASRLASKRIEKLGAKIDMPSDLNTNTEQNEVFEEATEKKVVPKLTDNDGDQYTPYESVDESAFNNNKVSLPFLDDGPPKIPTTFKRILTSRTYDDSDSISGRFKRGNGHKHRWRKKMKREFESWRSSSDGSIMSYSDGVRNSRHRRERKKSEDSFEKFVYKYRNYKNIEEKKRQPSSYQKTSANEMLTSGEQLPPDLAAFDVPLGNEYKLAMHPPLVKLSGGLITERKPKVQMRFSTFIKLFHSVKQLGAKGKPNVLPLSNPEETANNGPPIEEPDSDETDQYPTPDVNTSRRVSRERRSGSLSDPSNYMVTRRAVLAAKIAELMPLVEIREEVPSKIRPVRNFVQEAQTQSWPTKQPRKDTIELKKLNCTKFPTRLVKIRLPSDGSCPSKPFVIRRYCRRPQIQPTLYRKQSTCRTCHLFGLGKIEADTDLIREMKAKWQRMQLKNYYRFLMQSEALEYKILAQSVNQCQKELESCNVICP